MRERLRRLEEQARLAAASLEERRLWRMGLWRERTALSSGTVWAVGGAMSALAGAIGWLRRDVIGAVADAAQTLFLWLLGGLIGLVLLAVAEALLDRGPTRSEIVLAWVLLGPTVAAGLLAWVAAACGPPKSRRPIMQTVGWLAGCVLAALMTFGPAVLTTLTEGIAVGGLSPGLVAAGGLLVVFAAALTLAVLWRNSEEAHERMIRWGQIGFVGFAGGGLLVAPLLAALYAESTRWDMETAYFFTAFLVMPMLGGGAATLTGRWASRQQGELPAWE